MQRMVSSTENSITSQKLDLLCRDWELDYKICLGQDVAISCNILYFLTENVETCARDSIRALRYGIKDEYIGRDNLRIIVSATEMTSKLV